MTASLARVPCTVITGFLGAGKTTLIRHLLQNAKGRRLALIINVFGDIGVDGCYQAWLPGPVLDQKQSRHRPISSRPWWLRRRRGSCGRPLSCPAASPSIVRGDLPGFLP